MAVRRFFQSPVQSPIVTYLGFGIVVVGMAALAARLLQVPIPFVGELPTAYGPIAAVVFGWLLLVPSIYTDVRVLGYIAMVIAYIVSFQGIATLVEAVSPWNVIWLYLSLGMLSYLVWEFKEDNSRGDASEGTRGFAADSLFFLLVILLALLVYYSLRQQDVTVGLIGQGLSWLFEKFLQLIHVTKIGWLYKIYDFLVENLDLEYFFICTVMMLKLANRDSVVNKLVPSGAAAWTLIVIGVAVVLTGLWHVAVHAVDRVVLFLHLCTIGLGLTIVFLGERRAR